MIFQACVQSSESALRSSKMKPADSIANMTDGGTSSDSKVAHFVMIKVNFEQKKIIKRKSSEKHGPKSEQLNELMIFRACVQSSESALRSSKMKPADSIANMTDDGTSIDSKFARFVMIKVTFEQKKISKRKSSEKHGPKSEQLNELMIFQA